MTKSNVWNHFTRLRDDKGKIIDGATCNYCSDDSKVFRTKYRGTSNLWRHYLTHFIHTVPRKQRGEQRTFQCNICQAKFEGDTVTSSLAQHVEECNKNGAAAVGASTMDIDDIDPANLDEPSDPISILAEMIALSGYDPSIVDDDRFKRFVGMLSPEFKVPTRVEVEAKCDHIMDHAKSEMESWIDNKTSGRICMAVGRAQVMERKVIYTLQRFIDDNWTLHEAISSVDLDGPFRYRLGVLDEDIRQFCVGIDMEEMLEQVCTSWTEDVFMMACEITEDHSQLKVHINQISHQLYAVKREMVQTSFMDTVLHSLAEVLYLQTTEQFREEMLSIGSLTTRQQREKILSAYGVDPWAHKEAWFSWYCCLLVISTNCDDHDPEGQDPDADSELAYLLCSIWGEIYRVIKTLSAPKLPTSHLCLLGLFSVRGTLFRARQRSTDHQRRYPAFVEGKNTTAILTELLNTLDQAIHEAYLIWSVPLILDPRYKLGGMERAFKGSFGESSAAYYITMSTEFIKLLYSDYVDLEFAVDPQQEEALSELDRELDDAVSDFQRQFVQEELNKYLNSCVVPSTGDFDILQWWKDQGSNDYPTLALMVKDALAMPTSSELCSEQIGYIKSRLRGYTTSHV